MQRLTRNQWIAIAVAIIVVAYFLLYGLVGNLFSKPEAAAGQPSTIMDQNSQNLPGEATTSAAGSEAETATSSASAGTTTGPAATTGSVITVNYTLKLANGQVIDTSVGRGPFSFTLGAHQVISGWDTGLMGARAGDHKDLVIPPSEGYGADPTSPLKDETLYFSIDVLDVKNP